MIVQVWGLGKYDEGPHLDERTWYSLYNWMMDEESGRKTQYAGVRRSDCNATLAVL